MAILFFRAEQLLTVNSNYRTRQIVSIFRMHGFAHSLVST